MFPDSEIPRKITLQKDNGKYVINRVATNLENLENLEKCQFLTKIRENLEKSGKKFENQGKVRENFQKWLFVF